MGSAVYRAWLHLLAYPRYFYTRRLLAKEKIQMCRHKAISPLTRHIMPVKHTTPHASPKTPKVYVFPREAYLPRLEQRGPHQTARLQQLGPHLLHVQLLIVAVGVIHPEQAVLLAVAPHPAQKPAIAEFLGGNEGLTSELGTPGIKVVQADLGLLAHACGHTSDKQSWDMTEVNSCANRCNTAKE